MPNPLPTLTAMALPLVLLLAGCSTTAPAPGATETAPEPSSAARPTTTEPTLGAAATRAPTRRLAPGSTIPATAPATPQPLPDTVIAVVVPNTDAPTMRLVAGVESYALRVGATVEKFQAATPALSDIDDAVEQAVGSEPDLIVGVGEDDIASFDIITAGRLDWQFLIIGAQLTEPTNNVTAVIWDGAHSRGFDEPDLSPEAVTVERAEAAMSAGMASIRAGVTGMVLHLDEELDAE